ncbi:hypothetical protein RDWZM_009716 [Blomia tropicalis]|uniref:MAM and LDL-receptor class A domain-containing protein 1-like n=1 Tax=Blomia tropicalis TaxID=40697 RepID=A0A9Q0RLA2_BLOTA|nr:hypothetical protein RDWZM_009716 [Blomia tropicalis]
MIVIFMIILHSFIICDGLTESTQPENTYHRVMTGSFVDAGLGPRYLSRASNKNCPSLRNSLPNGWVRQRATSRIARFSCNEGFDLIGNRYATCIRGKWNQDLPVCVSSGCTPIDMKAPLKVKKLFQGNVIDLSCDLGYFLNLNLSFGMVNNRNVVVQSSHPYNTLRAYCVSYQWRIDDILAPQNDYGAIVTRIPLLSPPSCDVYDEPVNSSMKCDFEETLCGWFQDLEDDFDWLRNFHSTPSHLEGTGPSFDHTLGFNKSGYYLYLESSYPRTPNEAARLYSPVYQNLNGIEDICFQFYYHMYGSAIGSLRVYVLERSQILKELAPRLELIGDQGNQWLKAQIEINAINGQPLRPFQIVIEGILGHGHQGDIAIDDILLTLGSNCSNYNASLVNDLDLTNEINKDLDSSSTSSETTLPTPTAIVNNNIDSSTIPIVTSSTTEKPKTLINNQVNLGTNSINNIVGNVSKSNNNNNNRNVTNSNNNHINFIIDHFKSIFKPKKPTSTTTSTSTQTVLSNVTSFTTVRPFGKNVTKMDNMWKTLWKRMNETTQRQRTQLDVLRNLTTPVLLNVTTTNNSITLTSPPLIDDDDGNRMAERASSMLTSETIKTTKTTKSSGKIFAGSFLLSLIGFICLLVICASTMYIAFVYRPAKLERANLNMFVASFVRRCKVFRSANGNPLHGSNGDDDDDGELLVETTNKCFDINGGDDLHAYDNAHLSDGVVYLQTSNDQRF